MSNGESSLPKSIREIEGIVRTSAFAKATTAQIWDAIGRPSGSGLFQAVSQMRSAAVSLRNAGNALAGASETDALSSEMIGRSFFKSQPSSPAAIQKYQVNIPYSYQNEAGETITEWTSKQVTMLPATVGELRDYAQNVIDEYPEAAPGAVLGDGLSIQSFYG